MSDVLSLVLMTEVFVTLFVIMDPVGTIPIFLALNRGRSAATLHRAAWQAVAVSFAVIVAFAFFGQQILGYLHISLPALQAAGGLLLLLVALELLTGKEQEATAAADVNVALVPLGTPMLAGPGAIVATMVFSQRVHELASFAAVALGVVLVHVALWLAMRFSTPILRLIRDGGVMLVSRISGLLLSAIAVQLVADAVRAFVAGEGVSGAGYRRPTDWNRASAERGVYRATAVSTLYRRLGTERLRPRSRSASASCTSRSASSHIQAGAEPWLTPIRSWNSVRTKPGHSAIARTPRSR